MNYSKRMKRNFRKNLGWIIIFAIFFAITPLMFHLADLERGYNATGGEMFVPMIPFLLYAVRSTVADLKEERKDQDD